MSLKLPSTGAPEANEANKSTETDMTMTAVTIPRHFIVVRSPGAENSRISSAVAERKSNKTFVSQLPCIVCPTVKPTNSLAIERPNS